MDTTVKNKPTVQAMTMAELLPGLSGICSKDSTLSLTTIKQPRKTLAVTRTAVKAIKPMTIAEMQAGILALKDKTPRRPAQTTESSNKKNWNSSVKVENKFRRITTISEQMKSNPVKKALNFQSKPKAPLNTRKTILNPETPKFPKPAIKAKKAIPVTRISGVCKIAETPASSRPNRVTISNKENYSYLSNLPKQHKPVTPKSILKHKLKPPVPDTPISNISWKSSDTSFLQKEKEINDIEEKNTAATEEPPLENIAEVSPPVSTPFKEYRNVQEFFNNSNNVSLNEDSVLYNDNTIMSFDNLTNCKENSKREESVIVSLCDMLNKATVNNTETISSELKDLLESEKQVKESIRTIDNCIKFLTRIKESYLKRQKHVQKLIQEKQNNQPSHKSDINPEIKVEHNIDNPTATNTETSKPCSVIKSPTYKIPKKNLCLRKKVFHKSMPNVSSSAQSPTMLDSSNVVAHNMYMKMKENMKFLNTPSKMRNNEIPDTPAITSRNLQNQLDKLYNGS
ncbi:uncharacterized protein LOC119835320 [Zerene cesonia]|uniref:uncharacterized protein LOC119835320 n=1 Tax=Zerene cesonia TaxID=33412 RepID=UPI0018E50D42|nr:uncharacterized protein LOC119835320 [Zerene cesonia]